MITVNYLINKLEVAHDTNKVYKTMKKIYLTKMYIKWNDTKVPTTDYRLNAKTLFAYRKKNDALASAKRMIEAAKTIQCSLYKKYFFVEEIELL